MFRGHAGYTFVRSPQRLSEADGSLYQLDQRSIPIVTQVVHEYAIAPRNEQIGIALRNRCDNGDGSLRGSVGRIFSEPPAFAVGETKITESGHGGMFVHIGHRYAKAATAAVHIKDAVLECCLAAQVVKIVEGDEIHQQPVQMSVKNHKLFYIRYPS